MQGTNFFSIVLFVICLPLSAGDTAGQDNGRIVKDNPASPADGAPRRWQVMGEDSLVVHDAPSLKAPAIDRVQAGTVLLNLGCERVEGRLWCEIGTRRGQALGHAPARFLEPAIDADGTWQTGVDDSAIRAGKGDFDVHGEIPCAQEHGQPMGKCTIGVSRAGGGDATAVARFANGFERTLYFSRGEFVSANATMSGNGTDTDWQQRDGRYTIRVDDQRYRLKEELILGK